MPRRYLSSTGSIATLQQKVRSRFHDSPLKEVGLKLERYIVEARAVEDANRRQSESAVVDLVDGYLNVLPSSFGERFFVDGWMIQDICETWERSEIQFSRMIVPQYAGEWGHKAVPLPSENRQRAHVLHLISFPGGDSLVDINLLEYPLLCHELVHNLLFRSDQYFSEKFAPVVESFANSLRLKSLPDGRVAKARAEELARRIQDYWYPTSNHFNWAHEIAVDVIALCVCGPAYLATMQDVFESDSIHPYQVSAGHPPYDIRAKALISAGSQLGWNVEIEALQKNSEQWARTDWASQKGNDYVAVTDGRLIRECVGCALSECKTVKMPRCDHGIIEDLTKRVAESEVPESAIELIVAAWIVYKNSPAHYPRWQENVTAELYQSVKP